MQIISLDIQALPTLPPIALTIGNYDGVHLGHQALLSALVHDAATLSLASAVMVFEPQPREFFSPKNPPPRLSSLAEKATQIANLGIDYLLVANFNEAFCAMSATAFAQLLKHLNVRHLVLGDDFRFGHDRKGDRSFLLQAGFGVDNLHSVLAQGMRISSSLVRQTLAAGDLIRAKVLLGRDYDITGEVLHGDKIGRTLNFPTANVALSRLKPALHGVLGVDVIAHQAGQQISWQALGVGGVAGLTTGSLFGAANIGLRPSVAGKDWRLEVHLPKFSGDLYGITLQVIFRHFLHGERHYDSLAALKSGIHQDVDALLNWRNSQTQMNVYELNQG